MSMISYIKKHKKGATSMFLTLFVVVLFGIITLAFTALTLSEARETTNSDLSQSAYDAALAGIEDAKLAVQQYQFCLSEGNYNVPGCANIIQDMQEGIKKHDCDVVKNVLDRQSDSQNGVIVQEVQKSTDDNGASESMQQAYTCVTIEEDLKDYRTTLNSENSTRIIPLRSQDMSNVDHITLYWYSESNAEDALKLLGKRFHWYAGSVFGPGGDETPLPPILSTKFYQADEEFSLSDLSTSRGEYGSSASGTDRAVLYLKPVNTGGSNTISASQVVSEADKSTNQVFQISCNETFSFNGFACKAVIYLPDTFRNGTRNTGASFLIVSLPYNEPETDFSLELNNKDTGDPTELTSVQVRVDSTGRANDLYRRVETRLEIVDTYYPYPEYEIQMSDTEEHNLVKRFRTSRDCWYSDFGSSSDCSAYANI